MLFRSVWRMTSLLWTLEVIGITLLMLPFVLRAYHASRVTHYASGISALCFSDFQFPILFFLVAVPWPSGLENLLTQSLMRLNVTATVELLGVFGIPAIQHGNVIEIATGSVGIDEACSGIRSFQATLMLSLFFGEVYSLSARRLAFCVLVGFVLAFAFNVGRTLFLTQIASVKGIGAVAVWHDPAGVTILVACFLCLWLIARGLRKAESRKQKAEMGIRGPGYQATMADVQGSRFDAPPTPSTSLSAGGEGQGEVASPSSAFRPLSSHLHFLLSAFPISAFQRFQRFSIFLIAWLLLVEACTQLWYRSHEHTAAVTKEWSVNLNVAEPAVTKVEIPPNIRGQFNADRSLEERWQDSSGNAWQLYYFRWLPAHSLKGRVAIQLAKVHGPEICLPAAGMTLKKYLGVITVLVGDTEIALQQYLFTAEGRPVHIFYGIYEDPTGSAVLANRRQNTASRIKAALAGSRNYGQRFLEVAAVGYERPDDAKAALTQQLQKLIKVEE